MRQLYESHRPASRHQAAGTTFGVSLTRGLGTGVPCLTINAGSVNLGGMGRGIHHVDLAVADVERSLAFYLDLLGPLGWEESVRYSSYRGTEEVVYLKDAATGS